MGRLKGTGRPVKSNSPSGTDTPLNNHQKEQFALRMVIETRKNIAESLDNHLENEKGQYKSTTEKVDYATNLIKVLTIIADNYFFKISENGFIL